MLEFLGNEFGAPEAVPLGECINFAQETALDAYKNLGGSLAMKASDLIRAQRQPVPARRD